MTAGNLNTESFPISFGNTPIKKEGWLKKQSTFFKTYRKRWMVLQGQHLFAFKDEKKYENPTEILDLRVYTKVKITAGGETGQFELLSAKDNRTLRASSDNEMKDWIKHIRRAKPMEPPCEKPNMKKYERMKKVKLPDSAIRNKMKKDKVDPYWSFLVNPLPDSAISNKMKKDKVDPYWSTFLVNPLPDSAISNKNTTTANQYADEYGYDGPWVEKRIEWLCPDRKRHDVVLFGSWDRFKGFDELEYQGKQLFACDVALPLGKYVYRFLIDGEHWETHNAAPKTAKDGMEYNVIHVTEGHSDEDEEDEEEDDHNNNTTVVFEGGQLTIGQKSKNKRKRGRPSTELDLGPNFAKDESEADSLSLKKDSITNQQSVSAMDSGNVNGDTNNANMNAMKNNEKTQVEVEEQLQSMSNQNEQQQQMIADLKQNIVHLNREKETNLKLSETLANTKADEWHIIQTKLENTIYILKDEKSNLESELSNEQQVTQALSKTEQKQKQTIAELANNESKLKRKCQQNEDQIRDLKQTNKESGDVCLKLESQRKQSQDTMNEMADANASMEEKLQDMSATDDRQQQAIVDLEQTIAQLKDECEQSAKKYLDLKAENQVLLSNTTALKAENKQQITDVLNKMGDLVNETASLTVQLQNEQQASSQLKNENRQLQLQCGANEDENRQLNQKNQIQRMQLQDTVNEMTDENASLEEKLQAMNVTVDQRQQAIVDLEETVAQLKDECEQSANKHSDLKAENQVLSSNTTDLQSENKQQITDAQQKMDVLVHEHASLTVQFQNEQQTNSDLKKENRKLQQQCRANEDDSRQLNRMNDQKMGELKQTFASEHKQLRDAMDILQDENQKLQANMSMSADNSIDVQQQQQQQQQMIADLKEVNHKLALKHEQQQDSAAVKYEQQINEQRRRIDELESMLNMTASELRQRKAETVSLLQRMDVFKHELKQKKESEQRMKEMHEQLRMIEREKFERMLALKENEITVKIEKRNFEEYKVTTQQMMNQLLAAQQQQEQQQQLSQPQNSNGSGNGDDNDGGNDGGGIDANGVMQLQSSQMMQAIERKMELKMQSKMKSLESALEQSMAQQKQDIAQMEQSQQSVVTEMDEMKKTIELVEERIAEVEEAMSARDIVIANIEHGIQKLMDVNAAQLYIKQQVLALKTNNDVLEYGHEYGSANANGSGADLPARFIHSVAKAIAMMFFDARSVLNTNTNTSTDTDTDPGDETNASHTQIALLTSIARVRDICGVCRNREHKDNENANEEKKTDTDTDTGAAQLDFNLNLLSDVCCERLLDFESRIDRDSFPVLFAIELLQMHVEKQLQRVRKIRSEAAVTVVGAVSAAAPAPKSVDEFVDEYVINLLAWIGSGYAAAIIQKVQFAGNTYALNTFAKICSCIACYPPQAHAIKKHEISRVRVGQKAKTMIRTYFNAFGIQLFAKNAKNAIAIAMNDENENETVDENENAANVNVAANATTNASNTLDDEYICVIL